MIGLMKNELDWKNMTNFLVLRSKTYSYLTNDSNGIKKAKDTKKSAIKQECKYEDYKNLQEVNQIENEINYLETNNIDVDQLKLVTTNLFLKKNRLILKSYGRFKSGKHNVFNEKVYVICRNKENMEYIRNMQK